MRRKKLIWLLAGVLLLSLAGCGFAVAAAVGNRMSMPEYTKRLGAARTIIIGGDEPLTIKYVSTYHESLDEYFDIYEDEDGTRYRIDEKEYFVGYSRKASEDGDGSGAGITREQAADTAAAELKRLLSENEAANFVEVTPSRQQQDYYFFNFEKRYGKDGFLTGETVEIWVRKTDGRITFCSFPDLHDFEQLDKSTLDKVDQKELDARFADTASAVYELNGVNTAAAERYSLKKTKDGYAVEIYGSVTFGQPELAAALECYYALG